jgi:hypothetical protein
MDYRCCHAASYAPVVALTKRPKPSDGEPVSDGLRAIFAQNMAEARRESDVSLVALAEQTGISGRYLSLALLERQLEGIAKAKADGKYRGRKPTARAQADEMRQLRAQGLRASARLRLPTAWACRACRSIACSAMLLWHSPQLNPAWAARIQGHGSVIVRNAAGPSRLGIARNAPTCSFRIRSGLSGRVRQFTPSR